MTIFEKIPPGILGDHQASQVEALGRSLSPGQALWLSGYLAGLHAGALGGDGAVAEAAPAAGARTLTIIHAGETGNSGRIATTLGERARAAGLAPMVVAVGDYKLRNLKAEQDLLLVVATHGEGDPPEPAHEMFELLDGPRAPKFDGLRYAVLALGDSSYEIFCGAGRTLDERLAALGGTRLAERVECDVDYDDDAAAWSETVVGLLAVDVAAPAPATARAAGPVASSAYDKGNPFPATLLEQIPLVAAESTKDTRHLEFDLAGSGLTYRPGDALGVIVRNSEASVAALLDAAGLTADASVVLKGGEFALGAALAEKLEITVVTPRFLAHWGELSGAEELAALGQPGREAERADYLHRHHAVDIIRQHRVAGIDAAGLVGGFRPLQPRLYSLASAQALVGDEAHLTLAPVRYDLHGEPRVGVGSQRLVDAIRPGGTLPVYIQSNDQFRLPDDDRPIIMIGAGTGVAPYRAFLQEREASGRGGPAWLMFGERNRKSDFLYQIEWQQWLAEGTLEHLDVAFSRDGNERFYVQHRLLERADQLRGWVGDGANIYLCGDAAAMAPDVEAAMSQILGVEAVKQLRKDKRFQRDVY